MTPDVSLIMIPDVRYSHESSHGRLSAKTRIQDFHAPRISPVDRCSGFTLLELFVAFTLLAIFILPMLTIVHRSRVRSIHYATENEVRELAQRKLFERIYSYSEESVAAGSMEAMSGTFDAEGRPDWIWEIPFPQIVSQGEQVLLEYTIRVQAPQLASSSSSSSSGRGSDRRSSGFNSAGSNSNTGGGFMGGGFMGGPGLSSSFLESDLPSFEMTTWALPSIFWYLEQEQLMEMGIDTGFYNSGGLGGMGGF